MGVYDTDCKICGNDFEDDEEFLEMHCTCVVHTFCLMEASGGEDFRCNNCNRLNLARPWWL